jgi:tRNA(fMet)-specific endonuclease VapC
MIFLPDTNVFSRYLRDRPEDAQLSDQLESVLPACRLSAIVVMELEYGAAKRPEVAAFRERIARLQAGFPHVEAFDESAAQHTGFVRAFLANLNPTPSPSARMMRCWPATRWVRSS